MAARYEGTLAFASQVGASDSSWVVSLDSSAIPFVGRPADASAEPTPSITPARSLAGTSMPSCPQELKESSGSFMGLIWLMETPAALKWDTIVAMYVPYAASSAATISPPQFSLLVVYWLGALLTKPIRSGTPSAAAASRKYWPPGSFDQS